MLEKCVAADSPDNPPQKGLVTNFTYFVRFLLLFFFWMEIEKKDKVNV